jgi:RHS repeat-associated protein
LFKVIYNTGTLCHSVIDYESEGFLPCTFSRVYRSSPALHGPIGFGWHWPWDVALRLENCELVYTASGGLTEERFDIEKAVNGLIRSKNRATLFFGESKIGLSLANPWIYEFAVPREDHQSVRLESIRDLHGNTCRCLNWNGQLYELTDANGRRYRIIRDFEERITGIEIVEGGVPAHPRRLVTYEYDHSGDLVRAIDRCGNDAEYQYDNHLLVAHRNRTGGWYYADYDASRRCICTHRSDNALYREYRHDPVRRHVLLHDALGYETLLRFDEVGKLTEEIDPTGSQTRMIYDRDGGLVGTIGSSGASSTVNVHSSSAGEEVRMCGGDGCEYTTTTNLTDRTETIKDCAGAKWTRTYDEVGNVISLSTPLGATYRYEYDARGELITVSLPNGRTIRYSYSADYRRLEITDSLGPAGSLSWDEEGRLLRTQMPECNAHEYGYDALGRLTEMIRPNGASLRFQLDPEGNCISLVNELGDATDFEWSLFGELISDVDPLGGRVRYGYDDLLRLVTVTNANGERMHFVYDALGRHTSRRFFDGTEESFQYDVRGALRSIAYSDGSAVELQYDAVGHLLAMSDKEHAVRFEYDPRGYPLMAARDGVVVQYEYDLEGHPVLEVQDGLAIRRKFDAVGNCISISIPELGERRLEYDTRQRLVGAQDFNQALLELSYDLGDRVRSVVSKPDLRLEYDYLRENRLSRVRLLSGAESWETRYTYDRAGRVIRRQGPGADNLEFQYDSARYLRQVAKSDGSAVAYRHTESGDPLFDAAGEPIVYAGGGRVSAVGGRRFQYDGRGRLVEMSQPGLQLKLSYDHLNWLTNVESSATGVTEYEYDALGRRMRKSGSGEETRFIWDGEWLLAELGPGSSGSRTYLGWEWRMFSWSTPADASRAHLVLSDINGYPLISAGSSAVSRYVDHDVWGAKDARPQNADADLSIRFAGQYEDRESGLFYNRYRYYDPTLRRYLTPDPIGLEGSVNAYGYQADPVNYIDPHGLASVVAHQCGSGPVQQKTAPDPIPTDPGCSRGNSVHNDCITKTRARARTAKYATRADQSMEHGNTSNRPDLAISVPGKQRVYIEWDNPPATRAAGHRDAICASDPGALVILVTLSTKYGAPGGPTAGSTTQGPRSPKAKMGKGSGVSDADCGITDINNELAAAGLPQI